MRLRTKLFLAWSCMMLLVGAMTLWRVQQTVASSFDRVAIEDFAGTRRSVDALHAERLKQMRQACSLMMNIPELRALIAEVSSEISASNVESLNERLDALSQTVGVDLMCVLDNRGTLIAQNGHSPWESLDLLSEYLIHSPQGKSLVHEVFTSHGANNSAASGAHGFWVNNRRLFQVVGVPLIFADGSDDGLASVDGALIVASTMTDAFTAELGKGHNCQITFLAQGAAVASTFDQHLREELGAKSRVADWTAGEAFEMELGGESYRSWLEPIQDPCSGQTIGCMLVQVSVSDLKQTQARLSRLMLGILGSGLLVAALVSFILSGAVTRPIAGLVSGVRKVAEGNLDLSLRADGRDEVGELARAFNDMVSQLRSQRELRQLVEKSQASSRAKSQFLANMSHEIRTPLNGVVGMTQLLLTTGLNDRQRRYAGLIQASAGVLTTLIDDVLDFSKIEAGKLELESIAFSPQALIDETLELMASKAHAKKLEIVADIGDDLPGVVRGDPNRTRQILINLINNAIKFTERGEVVIRARRKPSTRDDVVIHFSVTDTGVGIPAERRDRLFKSFSQVDASTTRKHGGTGLGLAICKQLAELMGGSIGVESIIDRGSTFWFTAKFLSESSAADAASHTPLKSVCALVADEHLLSASVARRHLQALDVPTIAVSRSEHIRASLADLMQRSRRERVVVFVTDSLARQMRAELRELIGDLNDVRLILVTHCDSRLESKQFNDGEFASRIIKPLTRAKLQEQIAAGAAGSAVTPRQSVTPLQPGPAPLVRSERILLAEDNDINQMIVVDMLANAGYQCDVVGDGVSVVEAARGGRYSLILMDCQMPKMDGFEAARSIREHERASASQPGNRIPIVALTASAIRGDKQRCLDAGMDAYCTKPIDAKRLLDTIDSFFNKQHPPDDSSPALATGSVESENDPAIDDEQLLQRCTGKRDLADRVLQLLADKISNAASRLQQCVDENDINALVQIAHAIRGAAGMAGAGKLHRAAANLEELGRAGKLQRAEIALAVFKEELDHCTRFIAKALHNVKSDAMQRTDKRE